MDGDEPYDPRGAAHGRVESKLRGNRLSGSFGVPQFWYEWSEFNADTDIYAGKGLSPR